MGGPPPAETDSDAAAQQSEQERRASRIISPLAQRLGGRLEGWVRREAILGCAALWCMALLAAFAGSLASTPPAGAAPHPSRGAVFQQAQVAGGYIIMLKVTPAKFGTNTFTATVLNAQGHPVTNAKVLIQLMMVEMDMGVEQAQLKPSSSLPAGTYTGQADLTMGGYWHILVKVLPPTHPNG
jgi:hypothetical protein